MKMKQSAEFSSYEKVFSYEEFEAIWNAVQSAGKGCKITIEQTSYEDRPYGGYTRTDITVEAGND